MAPKKIPINFKIDKNNCFICIAKKPDSKGYPRIGVHGKSVLLHRFIFTEMFGKIPEKLVVRHKCDNSMCINPEHLELGTQLDNVRDRVTRGRSANVKGSKHPRAKLNEEKVKEIKYLLSLGHTTLSLANKYKVSQAMISKIKCNLAWTHI